MALLKNKVTGTVYRDHVYFTGCYVLGPDKEFVRYPSYANIISEKTEVFTVDRLIIDLTFHLQYYIRFVLNISHAKTVLALHVRACHGRDRMVVGFTTTCVVPITTIVVSSNSVNG